MADGQITVNSIVLGTGSTHSVHMFKRGLILAFGLSLAGCGPVPVFYKPDASVARLQTDTLSCEVSALKDAPVANQLRRGPPQYIPRHRSCSRSGACHVYGGYFVSGDLYSVDVNARLRDELNTQCMENKGYKRIELPRCGNAAALQSGSESPGNNPVAQPAPGSCAVRDANGRWQIAKPAL